jgi:hypothetical protein
MCLVQLVAYLSLHTNIHNSPQAANFLAFFAPRSERDSSGTTEPTKREAQDGEGDGADSPTRTK